jgi:hypothetical protein
VIAGWIGWWRIEIIKPACSFPWQWPWYSLQSRARVRPGSPRRINGFAVDGGRDYPILRGALHPTRRETAVSPPPYPPIGSCSMVPHRIPSVSPFSRLTRFCSQLSLSLAASLCSGGSTTRQQAVQHHSPHRHNQPPSRQGNR